MYVAFKRDSEPPKERKLTKKQQYDKEVKEWAELLVKKWTAKDRDKALRKYGYIK